MQSIGSMYVKIFNSILDSSLAEDRRLRHFFIDLLLCSDADGNVMMTKQAICRRIGVEMSEVEWGLEELQKPDPESLSKEHDGRRIIPLEGHGYGWKIVNYEHYRDIKSDEQRRRDTAERVRRWRAKQRGEPDPAPEAGPEPPSEPQPTAINHRFKPPTLEQCKAASVKAGMPEGEGERFFNYYESNGWRVGRNPMKSANGAMANWKKNWEERGAGNGNGAKSVFELKTVLQAKELLAGQIKDRYATSGALDTTWSDESKHEEWRKLRGEIKALQAQIAGMA